MLALLFTGIGGAAVAKAADAGFEQMFVAEDSSSTVTVSAGETRPVMVKAVFKRWSLDNISGLNIGPLHDAATFPFTCKNVKILDSVGTNEISRVDSIGQIVVFSFDLSVDDTAKLGTYQASVCLSGNTFFDDGPDSLVNDTVFNFSIIVADEKEPTQLVVDNVNYNVSKPAPGATFDLILKIKNEGEITAYNSYISLELDDKNGLIPGYKVDSHKLGKLEGGASTSITLPITVLPTTAPGIVKIPVTLTYKNLDGEGDQVTRNIYITINDEKKVITDDAKLTLQETENIIKVKAGKTTSIDLKFKNEGGAAAEDITGKFVNGVSVSGGIIPGYIDDVCELGTLKAGKTDTLSIPINVTDDATSGLNEIQVEIAYMSNRIRNSKTYTFYLDVEGGKQQEESRDGFLSLENVAQSPTNPVAGGKISLSFDIKNDGNGTATDVRVSSSGFSSTGFEPADADPVYKVGNIGAGEKKTYALKLNVGKDIPDGINAANINVTYLDAGGTTHTQDFTLYVFNVISGASDGDSTSRPKLIISSYNTDRKELKAGSEFELVVEFTNTHSSKAAKNIMITFTQDEGVFEPSQGSNSIYIKSIPAGENYEAMLPMKVKTNVATGTYDVKVNVKYDYDDMAKVDTENGGAEENYAVKLSAVENLRPAIQNIYSENWEGVYANTDLSMYFEFYNMGMSSLNNVYVTVEGDFALSNNSEMKYVGSLQSYSSEYVDLSVVPQHEGYCEGTLVVHFEDSTGAEYTTTANFSEDVQPQQTDDFEFNDGGFEWDDSGFGDGMQAEEDETIMPVWLFAVICAALLGIGFGVTYGIIIKVKRTKLTRRLEEEE